MSAAKKTSAKKTAVKTKKSTDGLHYNKEAVITEYNQTFSMMMKVIAVSVAGIVLYFFLFATYLGAFSHEKHDSFVEKFRDRADISGNYDGLKLPVYEQQE